MGVVTSFRLVGGWGDANDEVSAGAGGKRPPSIRAGAKTRR